jgi:hypothetical protein
LSSTNCDAAFDFISLVLSDWLTSFKAAKHTPGFSIIGMTNVNYKHCCEQNTRSAHFNGDIREPANRLLGITLILLN